MKQQDKRQAVLSRMATPYFSSFLFACLAFILICFLFSLEASASQLLHGDDVDRLQSHNVELISLLPNNTCSSATKRKGSGSEQKVLLEVVHKHGTCARSKRKQHQVTPNQHIDILFQDKARVRSINSKLSNTIKNSTTQDDSNWVEMDTVTMPAKPGKLLGSGNYYVTVGLGTPKTYLSLIFDTGSDLTWTQCEPCVRHCYKQKEHILDPSKSSSYANVSCRSSSCSGLTSATGNTPGCSASTSTCIYGIQYGDSSFSVGYFSKDRITLTPTDVFDGFLFGCGQNNDGLFGGTAGLLGLGRHPISFVQQTAKKYNRTFSYCLPSTSSSKGYLSFGGSSSKTLKYTTLAKVGSSFYGLHMNGISVGGRKLHIPTSVFSNSKAIIDSGTVISRLPPDAYAALRSVFRKAMSTYPVASAVSILDTCYDLSHYKTFRVPKISFFFEGRTKVEVPLAGILYLVSVKQVCLAFAGNEDASDITILGNVQQKTMEVLYDVGRGRIGFGAGACN